MCRLELNVSERRLIKRIAEDEGIPMIQVFRNALVLYARELGYPAELREAIKNGEMRNG